MGFSPTLHDMTMSHITRRIIPSLKLPHQCQTSFLYTRSLSTTSRMSNPLQQASRIFQAFKKGGPTFGAWQVPMASRYLRLFAS